LASSPTSVMSTNHDLVLASASPRRRDLLTQIGVRFVIQAADIDERQREAESPASYVSRLALKKAEVGFGRQDGILPVLGADTIVVCNGEILGKPESCAESFAMLQVLSGTTHEVFSAVALTDGHQSEVRLAQTQVTFRIISAEDSLKYWHSGEPKGKAGGYAIQGLGAVFVERLEGSYSGVVGLPLMETETLLRRFNVSRWHG
jgi:septum formation protein